jgi:ribosomal protein S12 methylthiotransferase
VGRRVTVLLDKVEAGGTRGQARTEGQAPEVDGVVHVNGAGLIQGQFCEVRITGSAEYDLFAEVISLT